MICVIGGINLDIHLTALHGSMIAATSNPARATVSAGGVARNVAENLARWGADVALLGSVGGDALSAFVLDATARVGVDVSGVLQADVGSVGLYTSLHDADGELAMGASAMDIMTVCDATYIDRHREVITAADLLVLDGNLIPEAVFAAVEAAKAADVPVLVDPVSIEKARRLAATSIHVLVATPNADELSALVPAEPVAAGFTADWIAVTRGAGGVDLIRGDQPRSLAPMVTHLDAVAVEPVDVTGAGDALLAGLAFGLTEARRKVAPPGAWIPSAEQVQRALRLGIFSARGAVTERGSCVTTLDGVQMRDELASYRQ